MGSPPSPGIAPALKRIAWLGLSAALVVALLSCVSRESEREPRDSVRFPLPTDISGLDFSRASDSVTRVVLELIGEHFELDPEATADLVVAAHEKAEDLTSVHEFTQLLHRHLDESEKARIVGLLWRIAYADGRLDKYEDSLVRKISDLLYVSRGRVMRLKHDAELAAG